MLSVSPKSGTLELGLNAPIRVNLPAYFEYLYKYTLRCKTKYKIRLRSDRSRDKRLFGCFEEYTDSTHGFNIVLFFSYTDFEKND